MTGYLNAETRQGFSPHEPTHFHVGLTDGDIAHMQRHQLPPGCKNRPLSSEF